MSLMVRDLSNMFAQMSGMPINSKGGKNILKQAGIDTNSAQYKAAIKQMTASTGGAVGYTNPDAIKNIMRNYDKDGNYLDPITGLAGLHVTSENLAQKHRIISIPESSKEEMFELTKREFIRDYGGSGETKREDVFINLYKKMPVKDRLAAGNTLSQYERNYRQAFIAKVKEANPDWEFGKPFSPSILKNLSREDIESSLQKDGGKLIQTNIDYLV